MKTRMTPTTKIANRLQDVQVQDETVSGNSPRVNGTVTEVLSCSGCV